MTDAKGHASPADPLLAWRSEFPILARSTYLVSHSLGAMPKAATERLNEYTEAWATRGVRAWAEGWWRMPLTVGDEVGRIIGAPPGSVVMHQNVSICQSLILSCFDLAGRRNKIVYEDLNFPSVMYVYEAHRALGARISTVKSEDGITVPLDRMLADMRSSGLLPVVVSTYRSYQTQAALYHSRVQAFGALTAGYHSDMTRTVAFGDPGPRLCEIRDVVAAAQGAGIAAVRPGARAAEVDRAHLQEIRAKLPSLANRQPNAYRWPTSV